MLKSLKMYEQSHCIAILSQFYNVFIKSVEYFSRLERLLSVHISFRERNFKVGLSTSIHSVVEIKLKHV